MPAAGFRFHILDVFAEARYAGNPLAVVEVDGPLSAREMQALAAEFNFPETTFILAPRRGDTRFTVRIFTPRQEVPFAGHPALGTAHILRKRFAPRSAADVILDLKAGRVPVASDRGSGLLWMTQPAPAFSRVHPPAGLARVLGLAARDVDAFPVQEVSTGLPFVLVPLRSLAAVRRARLDSEAYAAYFKRSPKPIFLFCRQALRPSRQVHARMFAPAFGIPEDPATGSANGCLAAWALEHGWLPGPVDAVVEQGFEMGRPSLLHVKARRDAEAGIEVKVGGKVIEVAEGRLR